MKAVDHEVLMFTKIKYFDEEIFKVERNLRNVGRLRFELRTSRLKAGCSTAELATHFVKLSTYEIIPF